MNITNPNVFYLIKLSTLSIAFFLMIWLMLKNPAFDSILLSIILTTCVICIENILETYNNTNDLNCNKCIISKKENIDNFDNVDNVNADNSNNIDADIDKQMQEKKILDQQQIQMDIQNKISGGDNLDMDYTKYVNSEINKADNKDVKDANLFRMSIGNPQLVSEYLKDGKQFYDKLFTDSTNAPLAKDNLNSELTYGNYNYVAPLNKGMINPTYTYIDPANWYPIPPHPPVCVGGNTPVSAIINNNSSNDAMVYANLNDFNNTSRFTGNMNINLEYIKKFLNNSETCN
jgi:hypothetical protein